MKRTFEVDYDNPSELKKLITKLQLRRKDILKSLGYNEVRFNGSKFNIESLLPAFHRIYDSVQMEPGPYYVYFHSNPYRKLEVTGNIKHLFLASKFPNLQYEPVYVGKGIGDRYLDLNRNDSHRKIRSMVKKNGKDLVPTKCIEGLSEKTALEFENVFMYALGLRALSQHGILCNLLENDNTSIRNLSESDETIKKILAKNGFKL